MNENEIKAPPIPPKAPMPVFMPKEHPQEMPTHGLYDDNFAADLNLPASILRTKTISIIMGCVLLFGMMFGSIMFGGGDSADQPKQVGLQGVVPNIDLDRQYPRCGMTEKGQPCVLYIMNSSRYDKTGEDFFKDAVRLMEVSEYAVEMVNTRYAKQIIKPGYIAQIKVPAVR